eukprot:10568244-Lingulodinium_polyedra.AAC.1
MQDTVRSAVALFRGLVALLDPTPGQMGSGPEDVNFIFPMARDLRVARSRGCGGRGGLRDCQL